MYRFIGKSAHMLKKYRCAGCFCGRLLRFPHPIFRSSFSAPVPSSAGFPLRCILFSCSIVSWLLRPFAGCRVLVSLLRRLFVAPARFAYPSSLCRILVYPLFGSREAFLFFSCPLCSVHVYPLFLRLSHFHFLNTFFRVLIDISLPRLREMRPAQRSSESLRR